MRLRLPWPLGRAITWAGRAERALDTRIFADAVLVGLVLITLYAWWYSLRWGIRNDAPVGFYPAHLMRTGQRVIYRDIFDMNQPASFLAMGIVDWLFGPNDRALRMVDVAILAATCALTPAAFRMPRRLPGLAGSAVYAVFHLHDAGLDALQREVWILLFVVASGAAMRSRRFVLGGAFAGLAFFVKFHAIALALVLLAGHLDPATRWRSCGRWVFGAALVAAFLLGGLACFDAFDDWLWILRNYIPLYAQISGALGFEPDPVLRWMERVRLEMDPETNLVLWGLPPAFALMIYVERKSDWGRAAVMASSFYLAAMLYPMPPGAFWQYHFTPAFFGAGVVLGVLVGARLRAFHGTRLERVLIVCAALYSTREAMTRWVDNAERDRLATGRNGAATEVAAYLRSNLGPGEMAQPLDTVMGAIDGMWRADLPLPTSFAYQFFFFHHPDSPVILGLRARFLRELEQARPALIVQAVGAGGVLDGRASTRHFFELEAFLDQHYEIEHQTGQFTYYRRIDPWIRTPLPPEAPIPPNDTTCPPSWVSATMAEGAPCGETLGGRCAWIDGACECSGEAPGSWHCTVRPSRRRDDGCPRDRPPDGFECTGEPARCAYGEVELECTSGAWRAR